jgi:hypothetical protein
MQRQPQRVVAAKAYGHLRGPTAAARHGKYLEFSLKQWMRWVSYFQEAIVTSRSAGRSVVLARGIEKCGL